MTHEGDGIFTAELECTEPCLIWYSFIRNIEGQPEVRRAHRRAAPAARA